MNILEAKLSADHRNNLPDSEFGLPSERKFPLNDESHVRSAINYFKFAKPDQRRELAKNINMKLKKFNMKVKVSEKNPFYKYITKTYLAESYILEEYTPVKIDSFTYIPMTNANKMFDSIIVNIMNDSNNYINESSILTYERNVLNIILNTTDRGTDFESFITDINSLFQVIYKEFLNYHDYANDFNNISSLYYDVLNDILLSIRMKYDDKCTDYLAEFNAYRKFLTSDTFGVNHNIYYLNRLNVEMCNKTQTLNKNDKVDLTIFDVITDNTTKTIVISCNIDSGSLNNDMSYKNTISTLSDIKKKLESDIYIINRSMNINVDNNQWLKDTIIDLYDVEDENIKLNLRMLENTLSEKIKSNTLKFLNNINVTFNLDDIDIVRLSKIKELKNIICVRNEGSNKLYCGILNNQLCIITKCIGIVVDSVNNSYITYKCVITNDEVLYYLRYDGNRPSTKVYTFKFTISNNDIITDINTMMESFSINKNGDIKITFSHKKSYMDEYNDAHRMLIENYKNNNYEALKQNVAYMFLLISMIERDTKYKDRDPDTVKARAFAINDFKTHLANIQKKEPGFNFENYYKALDFDKYVININKGTIMGIKALLKSILL